MLRTFNLLLPALIPSWRFFDAVAPSPRIEVSLGGEGWQEHRPRPETLSKLAVFFSLFYNRHWNEALYLVSCAERIMMGNEKHSVGQILGRIRADLDGNAGTLRFRLVFVSREGEEITREIAYISDTYEY